MAKRKPTPRKRTPAAKAPVAEAPVEVQEPESAPEEKVSPAPEDRAAAAAIAAFATAVVQGESLTQAYNIARLAAKKAFNK